MQQEPLIGSAAGGDDLRGDSIRCRYGVRRTTHAAAKLSTAASAVTKAYRSTGPAGRTLARYCSPTTTGYMHDVQARDGATQTDLERIVTTALQAWPSQVVCPAPPSINLSAQIDADEHG